MAMITERSPIANDGVVMEVAASMVYGMDDAVVTKSFRHEDDGTREDEAVIPEDAMAST